MQTQFFQRADGVLAYDDTGGPGELVLMLPGMGDLRAEYRFAAPKLHEAGYRVVTADLRGLGESSADWPEYTAPAVGEDILALIDHLGAGPAHVVATSFTPAAAIWAAAERPQVIRSLILIGPFVRDVEMNLVQKAGMLAIMHGPWKVWAWDMFYQSLYPTRKPADFDVYRAKLSANLAEPGRFAATKAMGEASRKPVEERMGRVQAPVLVVMGSKDPDFSPPEEEARVVAERMSGQVAMIEGAGHYPQAEMPEKFVPVALDFLAQHQGQPQADLPKKLFEK